MFVHVFLVATIATSFCFAQDKIPANISKVITTEVVTEIIPEVAKQIVITNAIDSPMLAYKHWTGTYNPDTFTITINGTEIAQGAQHSIPADTKTINVMFTYSFMNGMRKGTKTVSYKLHDNIAEAKITFTWKDDWQVLVDNATAISKTST